MGRTLRLWPIRRRLGCALRQRTQQAPHRGADDIARNHCACQAEADLQALIDQGKGDVPCWQPFCLAWCAWLRCPLLSETGARRTLGCRLSVPDRAVAARGKHLELGRAGERLRRAGEGIQPHFARLPRRERAPLKSQARSRNTGYVGGRSMEQKRYWLASVIAVAASCAGAGQSLAYVQTNLVSDIPGLATITDPCAGEPLGDVGKPHEPVLDVESGDNTSTLYSVTGSTNVSKVNINPPTGLSPFHHGAPCSSGSDRSGQQYEHRVLPVDAGHSVHIRPFHLRQPERYHFRLGRWPVVNRQGDDPWRRLYRARDQFGTNPDLRRSSRWHRCVRQFLCSGDTSRRPSRIPPRCAAGLVPFNVQNIGGKIYVTYAPVGARPNQIGATAGHGAVAIFDENGPCCKGSSSAANLPRPGASPLLPQGSASSAATCWLATSASSPAKSTHSTQPRARSRARSR